MPKLDHVAIQVADIEASISFYTEKLGFELMFHEVDRDHQEAFAFLKMDGGNLELLQQLDEQGRAISFQAPAIAKPYCPHLALATDNLDKELARLKNYQIPVLDGPLEIPGSVRWLYFSDPDNNVVEYVQWLGEQVS